MPLLYIITLRKTSVIMFAAAPENSGLRKLCRFAGYKSRSNPIPNAAVYSPSRLRSSI